MKPTEKAEVIELHPNQPAKSHGDLPERHEVVVKVYNPSEREPTNPLECLKAANYWAGLLDSDDISVIPDFKRVANYLFRIFETSNSLSLLREIADRYEGMVPLEEQDPDFKAMCLKKMIELSPESNGLRTELAYACNDIRLKVGFHLSAVDRHDPHSPLEFIRDMIQGQEKTSKEIMKLSRDINRMRLLSLYEDALQDLDMLMDLAPNRVHIEDVDLAVEICRRLAKLLEKKRDYRTANAYLNKALDLRKDWRMD